MKSRLAGWLLFLNCSEEFKKSNGSPYDMYDCCSNSGSTSLSPIECGLEGPADVEVLAEQAGRLLVEARRLLGVETSRK